MQPKSYLLFLINFIKVYKIFCLNLIHLAEVDSQYDGDITLKVCYNNIINIHKFEPKNTYLEPLEDTDESDSGSSSNYTSFSDESFDEATSIQSSQTIQSSKSLQFCCKD